MQSLSVVPFRSDQDKLSEWMYLNFHSCFSIFVPNLSVYMSYNFFTLSLLSFFSISKNISCSSGWWICRCSVIPVVEALFLFTVLLQVLHRAIFHSPSISRSSVKKNHRALFLFCRGLGVAVLLSPIILCPCSCSVIKWSDNYY